MQESLMSLMKLQIVDKDLHELEQLKVDIPAQLEALKAEQAAAEQKLAEQEEHVASLEKDRRQHERDLETVQEQIQKYQGQLHSVKTNKEYDALQNEIQAQKAVISTHEDAILQLMTETEEAGTALETAKGDLESTLNRITEESGKLEATLATADENIAVKQDERNRIAMHIDDSVINTYNRIRRKLRGLAVVPIKKGACGGCFNVIPLQVVAEVRKKIRLVTCEGCGRILLIDDQVPT